MGAAIRLKELPPARSSPAPPPPPIVPQLSRHPHAFARKVSIFNMGTALHVPGYRVHAPDRVIDAVSIAARADAPRGIRITRLARGSRGAIVLARTIALLERIASSGSRTAAPSPDHGTAGGAAPR